jgi:hypothetical protein
MTDTEWKPLFVIVTKQWYDLIKSGAKHIEFRKVTPYWTKRIMNIISRTHSFIGIQFQLGYTRKYPRLNFRVLSVKIINHICHGKVYAITFK